MMITPDTIDSILKETADKVRNSTIDSCIRVTRLCKTTEEAERMMAKLRATT